MSSAGPHKSTKPSKVHKVGVSRRRSVRLSGKIIHPSKSPSGNNAPSTNNQWDDQTFKLLATTPTRVAVWHKSFLYTIFISGSEGIVAAKRAKDGSVLAVADSQIVVLHKIDTNGPNNQSYRLKGIDEHNGPIPRLLQYAHDSRNLFFTDNIHHSVQTYNLKEDRVCEVAKAHPSPITSFAISSDSNLILSCSSDPPVISLHNRTLNTTVDIKPKASNKPVITCCFHPTRKTIFVMAFADGVIAAYDSSRLIRGDKNRAASRRGDAGLGGGEHIHAFGHLHDPSIAGGSGVTALHFIPGSRSRAISVGEDGRLFILDFEKKDVLGSWHIGAPATALSIRPAVGKDAGSASEAAWMIAIGTIHGKIYILNGDGTKVCERTVDVGGGKILDVEWVSGTIDLPPITSSPRISGPSKAGKTASPSSNTHYPKSSSSITKTTISSLSEDHDQCSPNQSTTTLQKISTNPPKLPEILRDSSAIPWTGVVETFTSGYMQLFSPLRSKKPSKVVSLPENPTKFESDQRSAISAPQLWDDRSLEGGNLNGPTPNASATVSTIGSGAQIGSLGVFGTDSNGSTEKESTTQSKKTPYGDNGEEQHSISAKGTINTDSTTIPVVSVKSDIIETNGAGDTSTISLLREIKSIRARNDGESGTGRKGGLALFAPYMPSRPGRGIKPPRKAKQGIMCEGGVQNEADNCGLADSEGDLRIKDTPDDFTLEENRLADTGKQDIPDSIMSSPAPLPEKLDEISQMQTMISDEPHPDPHSGVRLESPEEDIDIWLAEAVPRKLLRKESPAKPVAASSSKSSVVTAKIGTEHSKKRKGNFQSEINPSAYCEGSIIPSTMDMRSSSLALPVSPARPSNQYRVVSGSVKSRKIDYRSSPEGGVSVYRDHEDRVTRTPMGEAIVTSISGLIDLGNSPCKEANQYLNEGIMKELGLIHGDMVKRFDRQERILDKLVDQMAELKKENEKLRKELSRERRKG